MSAARCPDARLAVTIVTTPTPRSRVGLVQEDRRSGQRGITLGGPFHHEPYAGLRPKNSRMEKPQTTPSETYAEDQSGPPEEVIPELVEELVGLLESGQWLEALERSKGLHPVNQGEVLFCCGD